MVYEVKFKSCLDVSPVDGMIFPRLIIKCREEGSWFWRRIVNEPIDIKAYDWLRSEMYPEGYRSVEYIGTPQRTKIFAEIIERGYNNDLSQYVGHIIRHSLRCKLQQKDAELESDERALSFIIDGWTFTTVTTKDLEVHESEQPN